MKPNITPNLFVTPKCERAIPTRGPLRRDYLMQSTLDGCVRRIEFHSAMKIEGAIVPLDAIIIDGDEGRHAIDFVDARPACDADAENLLALGFAEGCTGIMIVTAENIRREPRFSAAREVWRHHRARVGTDDRIAVTDALEAEGPVPLRALSGLIETSQDVTSLVYAMACTGEVELDLRLGLDERSIVRLGSRGYTPARRMQYGT